MPATLGILGSSKGNTYAVGSEGGGSAPAVGPVDPGQVANVLRTLNTISNPEPPQRITATGETLPSSVDKARRLRPPPEAPIVYVQPPPVYVTPSVLPGPAFPGTGGGGGGGGAVPGEDQGGADAPVLLGLTQTQLVIGGGLAVVAFLLLRKKKRPPAAEEV